jgi:hypothetical protein
MLLTGLACAVLTVGTALPAASASAAPASAGPASAAPGWRVDQRLPLDLAVAPQEFSTGDTFLDVEPVGPDDAWAVGSSGVNLGAWGRPVFRHWHAGKWLSPAMPAWMNGSVPGGWVNEFETVGGSSPDDVWALGVFNLVDETVNRAVHWNGQTWTKAVVPSQGTSAPELTSVLSFGSAGAWAFGCYCGASESPYIAQYSGGRWREVTPKGLPFGGIWTARAISPTNIWAVQSDENEGVSDALHYNGTTWSAVSIPETNGRFFAEGGLVASKTGGVWLSGSLDFSGTPVVEHLQNGKWTMTDVGAAEPLAALTSDGAGGLWAASELFGTTSAQIWHDTGGVWTQAADPAGVSGGYRITWMSTLPGSQTVLAAGADSKHELLLSNP